MSEFCNRFRFRRRRAFVSLALLAALIAFAQTNDHVFAQIRVQADPLRVVRSQSPETAAAAMQDQPGELVPSAPARFRATWEMMLGASAEATPAETLRRQPVAPRPGFERNSRLRAASADALVAANDDLSVTAPATLTQSFLAASFGQLGSLPPDPSGGAGPTQFIFAANGRIISFSRATGAPDGVMNLSLTTFFATVRNGASAFTPKVKYDRLAGRWFIIAATDALPGRIVIASSNASTITASTVWSFFAFDSTFTGTGCAFDSPTLGIDPYALYIGVIQFCDNGVTYAGTSGFVARKTSVIDGATPVITAFNNLTTTPGGIGPFAPQGVDVDDYSGVGFFVGVDNASFGSLVLRRVSNPGTTPTISGNITIAVSPTAQPINVRHLGNLGGANGYLDKGDDRLTSASVTNGRLWTAQSIGVIDTGAASGTATRDAVRWYEIGSLGGTPSVMQTGTLFTGGSPGSVDTRNYFVPSIATSPRGRTVVGFSAAGTSEFINGGLAERASTDAANTLRTPQLFTSATAAYNPPGDPGSASRGRRWGSASTTVLDGCDGSTIWTIQQFTDAANSYGLQTARTVGPGVPTPVSVTPSTVASGVASIDLQVTATSSNGTAFWDSGPAYLCRLGAAISGVTVNSVTLTSPTTVTINVSTVNATPGLKAINVINPDAQVGTSAAIFRVNPGALVTIESPIAGAAGQPVTVSGWAVDGTAASGTGIDAVHVYAYPAAGSPAFLGAATYGGSRPDIGASLGSRFTASGFTITAPSVLTPGPYTIVAYGHSTATGTFSVNASVAVTLTAPAPPFGLVDTPADNVTVSGELPVTGWALDDAGVAAVDIYRSPVAGEGTGPVFIGRAVFINGARPDVKAAYPNYPENDRGWGFMILTNMLPNQGNGVFDLYAYAVDRGGLSSLIGTRRITAANGTSTKPFGTIDTPLQGETVSGTIVNFGWALAKPGRSIPVDGSTIEVYIDGAFRGHPVYNNYRPDIATLFPGLANSNGAVGYFMIDTTTLANGLHTIQWLIRDNAGEFSGVGSRFFRVQNGS
jgi:hypothetical protein